MSRELDSTTMLRLMREERAEQLRVLREELDMKARVDGDVKVVIAPGFKVRSEKDGLMFTVDAVGKDSIVLRDADGNRFHVTDKEFEGGYRRD